MNTLFDKDPQLNPIEPAGFNFDHLPGQKRAKSILGRTLKNGRIGNAYLFYGPDGTGKDAMAVEFSKSLNCKENGTRPCGVCQSCRHIGEMSHPDIKFVFPRPKDLADEAEIKHLRTIASNLYGSTAYSATAEILIDQIRELKKIASLKIHHGDFRVFIISGADKMRTEAANALLKLLEEPPEKLVLILTTARKERLLPTITSRCQTVHFSLLDIQNIKDGLLRTELEETKANALSGMAMGSFGKALELVQDDRIQFREDAYQLLKGASSESVLDRFDIIQQSAHGRGRGEIKELLLYALTWLRDFRINLLLSDRRTVEVSFHNSDRMDLIEEGSVLFNLSNIDFAIELTENHISLIDKNAYVNLVLINYLNQLLILRGLISSSRPALKTDAF